jgi:hypothetical protein
MLVNCAQCTFVISSSTQKCPRCGHESGSSSGKVRSDFVTGDGERRFKSAQFERLVLAVAICIFAACLMTLIYSAETKFLAGIWNLPT